MPKFDTLHEVVIDKPPMVVYKAILNEFSGVTHWWMPPHESKLRGNVPIDHEGAIVDITIHRSGTPKFSYTLTKIVEAKSIEMTVAGDFVGTAKWTFEPTDGKTKVQFQFNVRTNRLLFSLVSPFVNIEKNHSDVMEKGFKELESYLNTK
jgi:uncharacterized protein YndB with AHSA1/START domain